MINITSEESHQIISILQNHLNSNDKVFAFGSRVKGNARKNSDLDLVIEADSQLPLQKISEIKESLAESDIPFRIDVSDWHQLSDSFKLFIEKDKVLLCKVERARF